MAKMFSTAGKGFHPKTDAMPVFAIINGRLYAVRQQMTYGGSRIGVNRVPYLEKLSDNGTKTNAEYIADGMAIEVDDGEEVIIYAFKDYTFKSVIPFYVTAKA